MLYNNYNQRRILLTFRLFIVILLLNDVIQVGLTKTEMFSDQQNEISRFAKAFGHPARVAILQHLFKMDSCVCGDLVSEIGLAQPTISQHLKELKHLGLIKGNVEGTSVGYCIVPENWTKMKDIMHQFLDQDIPEVDCC